MSNDLLATSQRRSWRNLCTLAIASLALTLFATDLLAEADGPDYFRVTGVSSNDVLNIRTGPSARSTKVGTIPYNGDGIQNLGCEGGLSFAEYQSATDAEREAGRKRRWCNINYQGTEGWAAAWYLAESAMVVETQTDALVAGTKFNATGIIDCSRYAGQPIGECEFGVVREGDGSGEITVFWPDGETLLIYFQEWTPVGYDDSEADSGVRMSVDADSGLFFIRIGEQRIELPDIIINGG